MFKWARDKRLKREFEEKLLEHIDSLYNVAIGMTQDRQDAEDLVQEAALRAYRNFAKFEEGTNFKAWITTVLRNVFINEYRRKIKEPEKIEFEEVQDFISLSEIGGAQEEILKQIGGLEEKRIPQFLLPLLKPALIGITGAVLIFVLFSSFNRPFPIHSEVVKEHIQFLQGKISIGLSSDKAPEVNKWLQAKLDFKVMTPDLSSQGALLQGARVCEIKGKKTAYIIYGKKERHLSVFMFDAKSLRFPKAKRVSVNDKIFYVAKEKGYNSVLWLDDGIACVFVSDIGEAELLHLASL